VFTSNVKRIAQALLLALLLAGPGTASIAQNDSLMWFPLGAPFRVCDPDTILGGDVEKKSPAYDGIVAEVYQEGRVVQVQSQSLSLVAEPRWFRTAQLPKTLGDVPLSDQGGSLSLDFAMTTNGLFRFILKVHCTDRGLWREVEHRWTNLIPFLFTFYADGVPVRAPMPKEWGRFGGVNGMTILAAKGAFYESDLTVDPKTILALVPGARVSELSVVAAFGESQHEFIGSPGLRGPWRPILDDYKGPPIFIRSNLVRLRHVYETWQVIQGR
jgi:hypothetical protein